MRKIILKYTVAMVLVLCFVITTSCTKRAVQTESLVNDETTQTADTNDAAETGSEAEVQDAQQAVAAQQDEQAAKDAERHSDASMAVDMFVSEDIYFEFDSISLTDVAREVLARKAAWLQMNPDASVIIEGHCDDRGTSAYNVALGDRRAESVKTYLVNLGIDADQFTKISYGEERPVDPGRGEQAWAKNRRAHFVVE